MCHRFVVRRTCGTWIGNVKVLWRIFASFWMSWDAVWLHFGCLGTLLGLILGLSGPLEAPSWAKMAQDSEKCRFFVFNARIWDPSWDPKSRKIDIKNHVFFRCVFDIDCYGIFIDLPSILDLNFECFLNRFLD